MGIVASPYVLFLNHRRELAVVYHFYHSELSLSTYTDSKLVVLLLIPLYLQAAPLIRIVS